MLSDFGVIVVCSGWVGRRVVDQLKGVMLELENVRENQVY